MIHYCEKCGAGYPSFRTHKCIKPEGLSKYITKHQESPKEGQMSEWISVEDRLPEPDTLVLIYETTFARTDRYEAKFQYSIKQPAGVRFGSFSSSLGYFRPHGCNGSGYNVTHWQPLPEPPND